MWIMISGPYRSNTRTQAERTANLRAINAAAYEVFLRGHTPVIGVNMTLPVIDAANGTSTHDHYDEVMMPLSLALAHRCDAVLRIGGPSQGADDEVKLFEHASKPIYRSVVAIPQWLA